MLDTDLHAYISSLQNVPIARVWGGTMNAGNENPFDWVSFECFKTVLHTDKHKLKVTAQTNGLFIGVISRTAQALEMNSKPPLKITGLRSFLNRKWAKSIWKLSYS